MAQNAGIHLGDDDRAAAAAAVPGSLGIDPVALEQIPLLGIEGIVGHELRLHARTGQPGIDHCRQVADLRSHRFGLCRRQRRLECQDQGTAQPALQGELDSGIRIEALYKSGFIDALLQPQQQSIMQVRGLYRQSTDPGQKQHRKTLIQTDHHIISLAGPGFRRCWYDNSCYSSSQQRAQCPLSRSNRSG